MNNPHLETILAFLQGIGIKVIIKPIDGETFLAGLRLENGKLVIDPEQLLYPGDVLHEAGHLATMPLHIRETMSDNLEKNNDLNQGGEMMTLAWTYAACVRLNLDPHIVFHEDGYKGGGANIVNNFVEGNYIGVPVLQWAGMTYDEQKGNEFNEWPYPNTIRWLGEN